MSAAEELFATRRLHEITTDAIAQTAKVGKGTIYRYFQDKDDLFFQTATAGFDDLCALIEAETPSEDPFGIQLLRASERIADYYGRRRSLIRMMLEHEERMPWAEAKLRRRWHEKRQEMLGALAKIFEEGVQTGAVRTEVPPLLLARLYLSLMRTRAQSRSEDPASAIDLGVLVDLFCHGVCVGGSADAVSPSSTFAKEQQAVS